MDGIGKTDHTVTFSQWVIDTAPKDTLSGSGVRNAYEYGAMAAFGGRELGNIYVRSDCVRAEREGRQDAKGTIEGGVLTVLCDCCMQPFPVFNGRGDK